MPNLLPKEVSLGLTWYCYNYKLLPGPEQKKKRRWPGTTDKGLRKEVPKSPWCAKNQHDWMINNFLLFIALIAHVQIISFNILLSLNQLVLCLNLENLRLILCKLKAIEGTRGMLSFGMVWIELRLVLNIFFSSKLSTRYNFYTQYCLHEIKKWHGPMNRV